MISLIILTLLFMAFVAASVLVVSACMLSSKRRRAEEEWSERVDKLEDAMREELAHYQSEWASVGNHPASRYRRDVEFYQDLLND